MVCVVDYSRTIKSLQLFWGFFTSETAVQDVFFSQIQTKQSLLKKDTAATSPTIVFIFNNGLSGLSDICERVKHFKNIHLLHAGKIKSYSDPFSPGIITTSPFCFSVFGHTRPREAKVQSAVADMFFNYE